MPEPRSEWGREVVERVEQLESKVDSLTPMLQKVDDIMIDMRQLSADRHTLAQAASRVDVQLAVVVKQLEELRQDMKEFVKFKTTGENLIWVIKWILSPPLILALLGVIVVGFDIRYSVNQHSDRIGKLEQATAHLQESTAENARSARTLADNVAKNTEATKQIVAEMQNELKALSPVKVDFAKTHEVTARFFLTKQEMKKTQFGSITFNLELTHPIDKGKVEKTKVTAQLSPTDRFEQKELGFANLQLQAGLSSDGRSCWVEIFLKEADAQKLAEHLRKNSAKVPVDIKFTIPD